MAFPSIVEKFLFFRKEVAGPIYIVFLTIEIITWGTWHVDSAIGLFPLPSLAGRETGWDLGSFTVPELGQCLPILGVQ